MTTPRRTRAEAYSDWQDSDRRLHLLLKSGAAQEAIDAERRTGEKAYAEYMAWKKADTFAACAGAFDHSDTSPFHNPDY